MPRILSSLKKYYFFLFALCLSTILFGSVNAGAKLLSHSEDTPPKHFVAKAPEEVVSPDQQKGVVLGTSTDMNFVSGRGWRSDGGLVVLSTNESPKVSVQSYQGSGNVQFSLYQASKEDLINYLLYQRKKDSSGGGSLEKVYHLDLSQLSLTSVFEKSVQPQSGKGYIDDVDLPIEGTGVWFVQGKYGEQKFETMVLRTNLGAIVTEGDNEDIFWVQDKEYRSNPDVQIALFNLENAPKQLLTVTTNEQGIATTSMNESFDIALVTKGEDFTIIPVNLTNLDYRSTGSSWWYPSFTPRTPTTRSFIFSDRFLYQPGDTAYFKAIVREDDDVEYSIRPQTVIVKAGDYNEPFFVKTQAISDLGSVDGEIAIPKDMEPGYYSLSVYDGEYSIASTSFQVAKYRKPDSIISVQAEKLQYLPKQTVRVHVQGEYFLGQPIKNGKVRYKVYEQRANVSGDFEHVSFSDRLAYFGEIGEKGTVYEGEVTLDERGQQWLELPAKNTSGYRQFWFIEFEYLDGAGNATNDGVRVLIQPGNFVIERKNQDLIKAEQNKELQFPLQLYKNKTDAIISNVPLSAKLYVSNRSGGYTLEKDGLSAISNAQGEALVIFTPQLKDTSYKLEIEAKDDEGNLIRGEEGLYVHAEGYYATLNPQQYSITGNKETYAIGDVAQFSITADPQVKNVFVSLGRDYSREYRVLPVINGKASVEFPIIEKYQPNFYITVGSFGGDKWNYSTQNFLVNTDDKKVSVHITTDQQTYGPQENAQISVEATDGKGNPVQTDLALWVFDKALLELHGVYFKGIFERFWSERFYSILTNHSFMGISSNNAESGGGCFSGDTLVSLADGSSKRIDQISQGDDISTFSTTDTKQIVSAKVLNVHKVTVSGYLIINSTLRVTPEHRMYVNNTWKTAGEIEVGDVLLNKEGKEIKVTSLEWVRATLPVYNLEVETYHTYFAGSYYVHNEKGDSRSVFKDTAYWNPHVTTGADGKATVSIPLPDNLTTWVVAAVSANAKTQVGEGMQEFKVAKDIVVRPILPRFFRYGDSIHLSALLHNFTEQDRDFNITASFSYGELSDAVQKMTVKSTDVGELVFPTTITKENGDAVFIVKATDQHDSRFTDQVTEKIPVYEYGSWQSSFTDLVNSGSISLPQLNGADATRSKASLSLSTVRYPQFRDLLNDKYKNTSYPEGAARTLISHSLLKKYGQQLGINVTDPSLDSTIAKALDSIKNSRNARGVWEDGKKNFDPAKTRYLMEALVMAQQAGIEVDQEMIRHILEYYTGWNASGWEYEVEKQYVFSLFPQVQLDRKAVDLSNTAHPEKLALALLANQRQGFISQSNALAGLMSVALESPTQLTWHHQYDISPSWGDVIRPTIWATRAMIASDTDQNQIEKSLDYLYRNEVYGDTDFPIFLLATLEYYRKFGQLSPNYTYSISLNGQQLKQGNVSAGNQIFPSVTVPVSSDDPGASLQIEKTGEGKLYAQLHREEFFVDRELSAEDHNLHIERKYLSTKQAGEPTQVGDLIVVQFQVIGLGRGERFVEIEDYLPSGLVAIDETLDNGKFDNPDVNSTFSCQELTDQGMHICFSRLLYDDGVYSYKARVVSEGVFDAPPSVVYLTHQPSIWARTKADQLIIDGEHTLEVVAPKNIVTQPSRSSVSESSIFSQQNLFIGLVIGGLTLIVGGILWIKKAFILSLIHRTRPPIPPGLPL